MLLSIPIDFSIFAMKKTPSGFTGDARVGVCKYGRLFWEQV